VKPRFVNEPPESNLQADGGDAINELLQMQLLKHDMAPDEVRQLADPSPSELVTSMIVATPVTLTALHVTGTHFTHPLALQAALPNGSAANRSLP
jgi:hypothetical protein